MGEALLIGVLVALAVFVARSGLAEKRDLEELSSRVCELEEEVERLSDEADEGPTSTEWLERPFSE